MTEYIEQIKKAIESSSTFFVAQDQNGVGIVLTKENLSSLITTIESQKEEIENLEIEVHSLKFDVERVDELYEKYKANCQVISEDHEDVVVERNEVISRISSLKAITELAVNGLEEIRDRYGKIDNKSYSMFTVAFNTLSEIERLQNDPMG